MRDHFVKSLTEAAKKDPRIILITGDLGFGVLNEYRETLPDQFLNVGVAEQNMTGVATGLGLDGHVVFTYSIGNFPTLRCLEQIRNDVCYHGVNVNIVSVGGGFSYGALGISHHATEDLAVMRAMPEMIVLAPGCDWESAESAYLLASTKGAGYVRLDKTSAGDTSCQGEILKVGSARRLRDGSDLTILTCGGILREVLSAAEKLSEAGIEVRVVSVFSVRPLDEGAVVDAARTTGGILTVEEHSLRGGLGGAVAECLMDRGVFPKRFRRLGLKSEFSSIVGSQDYLREVYGLSAGSIVEAARETLE